MEDEQSKKLESAMEIVLQALKDKAVAAVEANRTNVRPQLADAIERLRAIDNILAAEGAAVVPIGVTPSVLSPAPASIEAAATAAETLKKKGWGKFWDVTKRVLKVAAPVALAGATGGAALPALLPGVLAALSDPTVAGAAGAGIAGAVATGVRVYGALKTTDQKE